MDRRYYLGGSNVLEYHHRKRTIDCSAHFGRSDHVKGHPID